jgi:hypothetical protein
MESLSLRERDRCPENRRRARRSPCRWTPIPTKKLAGTVTAVANVGEQRPNADSKVFEVKILLAQADTTLVPG